MLMMGSLKIAFLLSSLLSFSTTALSSITTETVSYTDSDFPLTGYLAYDPSLATNDEPKPGILILPDWNGATSYEFERARKVAKDLGYVAMVADIFGATYSYPEDLNAMMADTNLYRDDVPLYVGRIEAALAEMTKNPFVDATNVAVIGYCFGGTGVIDLAISGTTAVKGVVSFHGGLTARAAASAATDISAKMLILSGGSDDASSHIEQLEGELNNATALWEITRYSGVGHSFTEWGTPVEYGLMGYNPRADFRSWNSMVLFLDELFNNGMQPVPEPEAGLGSSYVMNDVSYNDGEKNLTGYLAYDGNVATPEMPKPGVIIVPNWDGIDGYEESRAKLLAQQGYVAMVADIYGASYTYPEEVNSIYAEYGTYTSNITLFNGRIHRAIQILKSQPNVDTSNIAAIGYCFGGTGVINLAISGTDEIQGIVSFHGGLTNRAAAEKSSSIPAKMLILSGGEDDASSSIEMLEGELTEVQASWEISRYSGVAHSFTEWGPEAARGENGYNPRADYRSWKSMLLFFDEIFEGVGVMGTSRSEEIMDEEKEGMTTPTQTDPEEKDVVDTPIQNDPEEKDVLNDSEVEDEKSSAAQVTQNFLSLFSVLSFVLFVV